jgi:hypothetical protein
VLEWAASGGMALTGFAGGVPSFSPAGMFGRLTRVLDEVAEATARTGTAVRADAGELIAGRAGFTGVTRQGQVSAGGATRLLRCAGGGWCAVALPRPEDMDVVPAILGVLGRDGTGAGADPWAELELAACSAPAAALAEAGQLVGVAAAALPPLQALPSPGPWPPGHVSRIAGASASVRLGGALVVDLSSMWAGPLCARLLGLGGARVVKVESPDRPDGARAGNPDFYDWLHAGHESVAADFRSASGRESLRALLAAADVVIEGSRPRALEQLGLAPGLLPHRAGQVWLSITGHGRAVPGLIAFGDDAAVAGGLVGLALRPGRTRDEPVFCADAVADPLTGVSGALAVAQALADGGGQLIDLPMRGVAAGFAGGWRGVVHDGSHTAQQSERGSAVVRCDVTGRDQLVLPPRRPAHPGPAAALGADTEAVLGRLALPPSGAGRLPARAEDLLLGGGGHPGSVGGVDLRGVVAAAAGHGPQGQVVPGPLVHPRRAVEPDRVVDARARVKVLRLERDQRGRRVGRVGEDGGVH